MEKGASFASSITLVSTRPTICNTSGLVKPWKPTHEILYPNVTSGSGAFKLTGDPTNARSKHVGSDKSSPTWEF